MAAVASTITGAACDAAASRSGNVSSGLDGASTHTRSAPAGGAPVWSKSTRLESPAAEVVDEHADAVVRVAGERDRLPVAEQAEQHARRGGETGGEEQRVPALERSERRLGGGAGRVPVAGVRELARLAVGVRPDGRSVDRRPGIHV